MSAHESIDVTHGKIGDLLIARQLLSEKQLNEALELQHCWGTRLGDIILAKGWVRAPDFYRTLASHFGKQYIDLFNDPPDISLMETEDLPYYTELLVLPWRREGDKIIVAIADPSSQAMHFVAERFSSNFDFVITSKFDIIWQVQKNANNYLNNTALFALAERDPEHSASYVFTTPQLTGIDLTLTIVMVCIT